jgi:hypothetical protein
VLSRRDRDDPQVVECGDRAGRDARGQQSRGKGRVPQQRPQEIGGRAAVTDHGYRPGSFAKTAKKGPHPLPRRARGFAVGQDEVPVTGGPVPVRQEFIERLRAVPVQAFAQAVVELHGQAGDRGDGGRCLPGPAQPAAEERLQTCACQPARRGRRLLLASFSQARIAGHALLVTVLHDKDQRHATDAASRHPARRLRPW